MPLLYPDLTNYWALGPCPWPNELDYVFLSFYLANFKKSVTGSDPAESININGVKLVLSL